jgi:hypothetical protein
MTIIMNKVQYLEYYFYSKNFIFNNKIIIDKIQYCIFLIFLNNILINYNDNNNNLTVQR